MMKKYRKRIVSILLSLVMLMGIFSPQVMAAPASDIPSEMLDNVFLDALAYTGFNVQAMKNNGTIFKTYGNQIPASIRSNITYNTGPSGLETVAGNTVSGLAPNIARYESSGLCCASYVSYVYFNYLPHVAGVDTSSTPCPSNPRLAAAYYEQGNNWVNAGTARRISFTQNSNGTNFTPSEEIPIGSLICYETISTGRISHVAVYAGYYEGNHFVTHVGNDNGPTISVVDNSTKGDDPQRVALVIVPEFVEENGIIEVQKKDTDGNNLAGAVFVATSTTDSSKQYRIGPTNASGYAYADGVPYGDYVIRETVFPTNYRSYGQTEWRVTVSSANDGKVSFNAVNEIIPGSCEIIKVSEDGEVDGISFRIKGTNVDKTVQTANGGKIKVDELKPGKYTVTELTPEKYVPQTTQTVTIESGKTSTVNFSNILKKWRLDVFKLDTDFSRHLEPSMLSLNSDSIVAELGEPYGQTQGDATLEGAVYGLFEGETLVDTYTTDKNGYFLTDYYICGENWTLREITPSEGYLLDPEIYFVNAYAENFSIELNDIYMDVFENIIKGRIAVVKHTDDGSTQIETPEVGAKFQVYLKSSGSYEKAKKTERDIIKCDETGLATTKELPYGVYTVEQTEGWEGKELLPPFDVFISQDGKVYSYIINNATFDSFIKVVKTDAETGKNIPYAGAGFQIYRPDGSKVEMTYTYPEVTTIDTFYTTNEGALVTPEMLDYGLGYMLVEVSAPYGYVLDSTPLYFDVTEENATEENGITLVKVDRPNMPQKGTITITKSGEVFSSVVAQGGTYQPVFEIKNLAGAIFNVIAAEDIYTPDGTLRYRSGEVVDTIETISDGIATTKPLYLGKYEITEVQAPINMVLNGEVIQVELVYAGQEIAITSTSASMYNERQKVEISLEKVLEKDEAFDIGNKDEILSVKFGLYAAEELIAEDGKMIPKDGLIEIATCDKDGKLTFKTDVPVGAKLYVQEVSKDDHYQVSDTKFYIEFEYAGQDVSIVHISVNNGEKIENKLIRGNICGKKVDEDGNVVEGAVFGLFKADETTFDEETAILLSESDKDGLFEFKEVPYGTWIIRELKTLPQYVLDETSYEITIRTHEEMIEITIENKFVTGTLEITKSDLSTGKLLPNVGFRIKNEKGEIVEEGYTDAHGVAKFTLRYGKYTYQEFDALDGYILDEKEYAFEITEDGQIIKAEMKNELIPKGPQTGDNSNTGFWIGLLAIALGGIVSTGIIYIRKKKDDDEA